MPVPRCAGPQRHQQWPGLDLDADKGSARSPSPVGRLVLVWGDRDDVEAWIDQKRADGPDTGSYPGPARVDVVGDAPSVVRDMVGRSASKAA